MSLKEVADKGGGILAIEAVSKMPLYEFIKYLAATKVENKIARNYMQQT